VLHPQSLSTAHRAGHDTGNGLSSTEPSALRPFSRATHDVRSRSLDPDRRDRVIDAAPAVLDRCHAKEAAEVRQRLGSWVV
jgi:hypothetical protein